MPVKPPGPHSRPKRPARRSGDIILEPAWVAFIEWAARQEKILNQFRQASGKQDFLQKIVPLDFVPDEIGRGHAKAPTPSADMQEFVLWVTIHYWGMKYAPSRFRQRYSQEEGEGKQSK